MVTPFNIVKETDARHPPSFKLSITAFGRDYHMELTRHETLIGDEYGEWTVAGDGSFRKQAASTTAASSARDDDAGGHCFYHGRLVGGEEEAEEDGSLVALSICDGVRGEIFFKSKANSDGGGVSIALEPAHRHVLGEVAPAAGARGTDGPLASSVLAFRREDEADGFRPAARAMLGDVQRAATRAAADKGYDVYEDLGVFGDDDLLARLTAPLQSGGGGKVRDRPAFGDAAGGHGRKLTQATVTDIYLELIIVNDKARVNQYGNDTALLHSVGTAHNLAARLYIPLRHPLPNGG